MSENKRVGQTIAQQVPASGSGFVAVPASKDGTVESLKVRVYAGAENTLKLRPQVKADGSFTDLLDYAGKDWLDGDDDTWEWQLSHPVERGHEVGIRYDNTDPNNPHNFRAVVDVDYLGGAGRVVEGVRGLAQRLPGVSE